MKGRAKDSAQGLAEPRLGPLASSRHVATVTNLSMTVVKDSSNIRLGTDLQRPKNMRGGGLIMRHTTT